MKMRKKTAFTFLVYCVILLLAGSAGYYLRLFPLRNFVSNNAWDNASAIVMNNAAHQLENSIEKKIKNTLTPLQQKQLVNKQLNSAIHQDRKGVKNAILKIAKTIDARNPPPQPYPHLLGSDSYYYYDLTRTLQQTGHISPRIKGSKYFSPKMAAPDGYWEPLNLHAYVGLALHQIITMFNPNADLLFSISFTPLILMFMSLIFFLITACNLKVSPWATAIAAFYFISIHIFLKRTTFGWYDNDPYNVLFPMIIMTILSFAFRATKKRQRVFTGVMLGISLVIYSLFWQGWVFIAAIIASSLIVSSIYARFRNQLTSLNNCAVTLMSFLGAALIGISLILGFKEIFILFQEGWDALAKFFHVALSVWPDNYITVGELKRLSIQELASISGGPFFLLIAATGLIAEGLRAWNNRDACRTNIWITCTIFGAASVIMSLGAQRFALLAVTPLILLFLFGIDQGVRLFHATGEKFFPEKSKILIPAALAVCACLLVAPRIVASEQTMPGLLNPVYNDTWQDALRYIESHTPENSIVDSWWPPGHFIKAIAQRRVIFDGATISNRQGYWLANALMATSEKEALDYFRLLNNSANRAVDLLLDAGMKDSEAVSFLKHIIHLPEDRAKEKIQEVLGGRFNELLALTHGPSDPAYLLVYNEMIKNLLLYPFVSRWDFQKIENINSQPEIKNYVPPASQIEQYIQFLWNINGGKPKISDALPAISEHNSIILFPENLACDMRQLSCRIQSSQYGTGIPQFLIYTDDQRVIKKPLPNANLPYSIVVGKRHGKSVALLTDTPIAESLLVRLYFFGDTGLEHIRLMHQSTNLTQQTQIDVFRLEAVMGH